MICNSTMSASPSLPVLRSLGGCGGTLVARVFAALPELIVLSETNPRSASLYHAQLNPLTQIREWFPGLAERLAEFNEHEIGYPPLFGDLIHVLYSSAAEQGLQLVVRDYNYVDFIGVPYVWPVPMDLSLDAALAARFEMHSAVLVRQPAAQLASLRKHRAVKNVLTAEQFLAGSLKFAAAMRGCPIFRYEDLAGDPLAVFPKICESMGIPWNAEALERFASSDRATGNFSRLGEAAIRPAEKSSEAAHADAELQCLDGYGELLAALGYAA